MLQSAASQMSLLLLLVIFSLNCLAIQAQKVSSCGDIHNISFPFKLKDDPRNNNCQDNNYTLSCEKNRTLLHLNSGKYYVQAINYQDYSIRVVDVGLQSNICSTLSLDSVTPDTVSSSEDSHWLSVQSSAAVLFLNCEKPVKSPLYIDISDYCKDQIKQGINYSYVLAGGSDLMEHDVAESCKGDVIMMTSLPLDQKAGSNFTVADVDHQLAYGFELSWGSIRYCDQCSQRGSCFSDEMDVAATCSSIRYREDKWSASRQMWNEVYVPYIILSVLITIGGLFSLRFLIAPFVFAFLIYKFKRRHLSTFDSIEGFLRSQNNLMPIGYSYWDIKKMTNGFKDKLGEGGYGSVYKGKLRSGHVVAVKMLSKPKADGQEFINEVATIGRIHHVNVVQLIGYCAENSKRALVYDFMPNGSLEKYIFSRDDKFTLSCEQMYKISLGVARGIEYLHRGCDIQILHFDIKPHNILLDENFTPKVSDFGLAKLYPTENSIVSLTAARGTMGYMAPELFYKNIGGVSYKADVYSFGMLLMEMAGRRRAWIETADSSQVYFPSWVFDRLSDGEHVEMGERSEKEREMVKKMMVVALWCIQMKPSERPSMNKVVEMLEGNVEVLQMPPKPFLYPEEMPSERHEFGTNASRSYSGANLDSISLDVSAR